MPVSCVGTCSHCGTRRFWLSDTLALQHDDGRLTCLTHPGECYSCEKHGLTLGQASERDRLYRVTFYVCRACGRQGETIEKRIESDFAPFTLSVPTALKWGWGSAAIVVPLLVWRRWWAGVFTVGLTLLGLPAIAWWENHKAARAVAARGLPQPDAPGRMPIAPPAAPLLDEDVLGHAASEQLGQCKASGPCCAAPDWIEAWRAKDEDRVPCYACGKGVMRISEQSIH